MLSGRLTPEHTADRQPYAQPAGSLDRAAGRDDDVLHDSEAEARTARAADAVGPEEPLEETRQVLGSHPDAVIRGDELVRCDRDRERGAGARVPNRVLREVVDDHSEHAGPEGKLRVHVALRAQ